MEQRELMENERKQIEQELLQWKQNCQQLQQNVTLLNQEKDAFSKQLKDLKAVADKLDEKEKLCNDLQASCRYRCNH